MNDDDRDVAGERPEPAGAVEPSLDPTSNPTVDEVLVTLDDLAEAPVSEHVAIFEDAHEKLRAALADAGTDVRPS